MKLEQLQTGYRIEFYLLEQRQIDKTTTEEIRRFYISPVYDNEQDLNNRIEELLNQDNFIDGVVVSCKILSKEK